MSESLLQVYAAEEESKDAYLLTQGDIYYFISNTDKYTLRGKNFILGASELILTNLLNIPTPRLETVLVNKDAQIKKISGDKFTSAADNPSFLLNIAMVTARQVLITNQIITENKKHMSGNKKLHKDVCIEYYKIFTVLLEEQEKRKLPWLKELIAKFNSSLTFKQGEIFFRSSEPVKMESASSLSESMIEIPKDSIVFEEGADGREMYILQSGSVDVMIGSTKVATISEPGTSIGEIALLLGEKRTATLKAANNLILAKISQADIKTLSDKKSGIFLDIAKSLAKKHYNNVTTIHSVNKLIIEQNVGFNTEELKKEAQQHQKSSAELEALKKEVSDIMFKKDAPFLKERLSGLVS